MRRIVLALFLASCAAAPPVPCELALAQFEEVDARRNDISEYARLTGEDAVIFMRAYNAVPPTTNDKADVIVAYRQNGIPQLYVVIANQGCVIFHQEADVAIFERLRGGLSV